MTARPYLVMSSNLLSSPKAQAIPSFPEPVGVLVGFGGEEVLDREGLFLGELVLSIVLSLGGVLVGLGAGVLERGRLEDLDLHRLVPRFFFAMPWWFGSCLAKWFGCTARARVWDGARVQRRIANVDSAKRLRSLMAGISSRVVKKREGSKE